MLESRSLPVSQHLATGDACSLPSLQPPCTPVPGGLQWEKCGTTPVPWTHAVCHPGHCLQSPKKGLSTNHILPPQSPLPDPVCQQTCRLQMLDADAQKRSTCEICSGAPTPYSCGLMRMFWCRRRNTACHGCHLGACLAITLLPAAHPLHYPPCNPDAGCCQLIATLMLCCGTESQCGIQRLP